MWVSPLICDNPIATREKRERKKGGRGGELENTEITPENGGGGKKVNESQSWFFFDLLLDPHVISKITFFPGVHRFDVLTFFDIFGNARLRNLRWI